MAWNISAGAIRNPIPPILLILALLFAGWTAYGRLPINQLPNVDFGGFTVTVAQAGASPAEMETQITQRIESALTAVEGTAAFGAASLALLRFTGSAASTILLGSASLLAWAVVPLLVAARRLARADL